MQLGDDLPSHILVPAIHRNRAEISEIFRTRMADAGRPAPDDLTDEPARLADAARLHLREKFLRAQVGVSGANFAVADTGTLVVVESEGNGRMCLTLPEVLVSVVGIEKVVPTWADLDVFLQLLPRSSTGERMNPYTSTWSGVTPGDGPQEVHVVLLDNGRTRALADEVGRQALRCIRCSACLNVCPVYERTGGHAYGSVYPGPIGAILNPLLKGVGVDEQTDSLPYASRCAGRASRPVRCASTSPRCSSTCAPRSSTPTAAPGRPRPRRWRWGRPGRFRLGARLGLAERGVRPRRPAGGAFARGLPGGRRRWAGCPGRARPGPTPGTCRCRRRSRSGRGGATGGGPAVGAREEILGRVRRALGEADRSAVDRAARLPPTAADPPIVDLFAERVVDYRAACRCTAAVELRESRRALGRRRGCWCRRGCRGLRGGVDDDGCRADLDAVDAVVTTATWASPRPARSCSPRPGQGRRALSLVPTSTSAWCGRTGSSPTSPTPSRCSTGPARDLDQRPVRDQRHRARPGRGRPRASDPARHRRG